jgi:hypothetical protein
VEPEQQVQACLVCTTASSVAAQRCCCSRRVRLCSGCELRRHEQRQQHQGVVAPHCAACVPCVHGGSWYLLLSLLQARRRACFPTTFNNAAVFNRRCDCGD